MHIQSSYNSWAKTYDSAPNLTRDLEAKALRELLENIPFENCLEIGCGTGKNTEWLIQKAKSVTSVDFSEEMLVQAKEKIKSDKVQFIQADITQPWAFASQKFDLVTFSLMLEHIHNLDHVFSEASKTLNPGGHIYIGELHPFKQYTGSKAKFESEHGEQIVECFTHHVSEFTQLAKKHSFIPFDINEYFDGDNGNEIPRVLTLIFRKK